MGLSRFTLSSSPLLCIYFFHVQLSIFLRSSNGFCLPKSSETPLILIGPGTGVAPFLGFLAHREELLKSNPNLPCGPVWLFYGCRTRDQDYLFKYVLLSPSVRSQYSIFVFHSSKMFFSCVTRLGMSWRGGIR